MNHSQVGVDSHRAQVPWLVLGILDRFLFLETSPSNRVQVHPPIYPSDQGRTPLHVPLPISSPSANQNNLPFARSVQTHRLVSPTRIYTRPSRPPIPACDRFHSPSEPGQSHKGQRGTVERVSLADGEGASLVCLLAVRVEVGA